MIIQGISKGTDPPKSDLVLTNVSGATITLGHAASYTTTSASLNGYNVVSPAVGQNATFAGIAVKNIPNTQAGRVRAYGYHDSIFIFATGTSGTCAIDIAVGPGVAGSLGVNSTGFKDNFGPVILAAAQGAAINSPGGYARGFVRAL